MFERFTRNHITKQSHSIISSTKVALLVVFIVITIVMLNFNFTHIKTSSIVHKNAMLYSILNGESWVGKLPDIVEGSLEYEVRPSTPTKNEYVTLILRQNIGNGLYIQYSTDAETWDEYTRPIIIYDNTTIYYRVRNAAHDESTYVATATIANIDRVKPTITTVETTSTTATITAEDTIESSNNGVAYYGYSTAEGELPTSWQANQTITGLTGSTTYYFYVKDKAGNISEAKAETTQIQITADMVSFESQYPEWTVNNVKDALDYLYER